MRVPASVIESRRAAAQRKFIATFALVVLSVGAVAADVAGWLW